ncbi:uncharacterized protein BDV17DRAFT_248353 [Aspergillus undulatus]|uniref:uncharacterized protein n=1 Tax=Aspergillus undulatus TaxID=1810928 RepID=UPI003CCD1D30
MNRQYQFIQGHLSRCTVWNICIRSAALQAVIRILGIAIILCCLTFVRALEQRTKHVHGRDGLTRRAIPLQT